MDAEQWKLVLLESCIREAVREDTPPNQKRSLVLFKLRVVSRQLRERKQYTLAYWAGQMLAQASGAPSIQQARADQRERAKQTPASNTGVNYLSGELENYVAGE
jgi:hypothetical protein